MTGFKLWLATLLIVSVPCARTQSSVLICEDSIDGQAPYMSNDLPCVLGCGAPIAIATGGLLPGSINETDIPYCQLNCVRKDPTPSQSAAAPGCHSRCQFQYKGTPENYAWCMYWCVDGLGDLVASTTCIPSLEYYPEATEVIDGHLTYTVSGFTQPAAWLSWYQTQTVISRTTGFNAMSTGAPTESSQSTHSTSVSESSHSTHSTNPTETVSSSSLTITPAPITSSAPHQQQQSASTSTNVAQQQQSASTSTNVAQHQHSRGLASIICVILAIFM